ncbi:unnamed protein product [Coccothraustes coccothraustes]
MRKSHRTFPPESYCGSGLMPAAQGAAYTFPPSPEGLSVPRPMETAAAGRSHTSTRGLRGGGRPIIPYGEAVSAAGNRWGGGQDKPLPPSPHVQCRTFCMRAAAPPAPRR